MKKLRRALALCVVLALSAVFASSAFAYVYNNYFNATVASGSVANATGVSHYYLFGEVIGPMAANSCEQFQAGGGTCSTGNTSYLYLDGPLANGQVNCTVHGRGSNINCRAAY